MYYFIYPSEDTTLFEGDLTSSLNAGHDQILEIQKNMDATGTVVNVSRVLIKFDYTDITIKRLTRIIPSDAK